MKDNGEWISLYEYADKQGIGIDGARLRISAGKIKKCKRDTSVKGFWLIHKSELNNVFKPRDLMGTKKYLTSKPSEIVIPEDAPIDFDLSKLDSFVVEKGPYSFKQLAYAVYLCLQRASWDDIMEKTSIKKSLVLILIEELKLAHQKEPNKYKTTMDYLNAGRPYQKSKLKLNKLGKK